MANCSFFYLKRKIIYFIKNKLKNKSKQFVDYLYSGIINKKKKL